MIPLNAPFVVEHIYKVGNGNTRTAYNLPDLEAAMKCYTKFKGRPDTVSIRIMVIFEEYRRNGGA